MPNISGIELGEAVRKSDESYQAELDALEREILLEPLVISRYMDDTLQNYIYTKTSDDYFLTPPIEILIGEGEDAQMCTVSAGYQDGAGSHKSIYLHTDDGEMIEWVNIMRHPVAVADGSGNILDTAEKRTPVRELIDKLNAGYAKLVTQKADSFNLNLHVHETIDARIEQAEKILENLRQQKQLAEQAAGIYDTFKVTIISGWADSGEKPLETDIFALSLSDAVKQAIQQFKKLNGRSDVQARDYSIGAVLADGSSVPIDREVTQPLFQSLSHWDSQTHQIDAIKADLPKLKDS